MPNQCAAIPTCDVTVLIPAYNEAASIRDTLISLQQQTLRPVRILVADDGSTDGTGDIARECGADVVRLPQNAGCKARAQNFALKYVTTEFVLSIDADTTLAPDAVEKIVAPMSDPQVACTCGFVVPRHVNTMWERGRYVEYMFAFSFYKTIQDHYNRPYIASGCFSLFRTRLLHDEGGWSTRTRAEDMDLTWCLFKKGYKVRFVPEAVCYPIEPHNFTFMAKQLRRWSNGFVQCLRVHWRDVLDMPLFRVMIAVSVFDAVVASFAFLFILPLLVIFVNPLFALVYLVDVPVVLVPALLAARKRGEVGQVFKSIPGFLVLRVVNCWFTLRAYWEELVVRRSLLVFEKGH